MFLDTLLDGYLYLTGINIGRHGGHTVTFTCLLALPTRRAGPQAAGEARGFYLENIKSQKKFLTTDPG